tara:strand:- start:810 stop:971 length:162 start_codon:yes stop_codon:yes gene_type:complete
VTTDQNAERKAKETKKLAKKGVVGDNYGPIGDADKDGEGITGEAAEEGEGENF